MELFQIFSDLFTISEQNGIQFCREPTVEWLGCFGIELIVFWDFEKSVVSFSENGSLVCSGGLRLFLREY